MDSWKKFEDRSLPTKDAFYSRVNIKGISDDDYDHAQQVWNRITPGHENITLGCSWQTCLRPFVIYACLFDGNTIYRE